MSTIAIMSPVTSIIKSGLLFLKKNFIGFFLKPFFRAFVPEKFRETLRTSFEEFYGFFGKVRGKPAALFSASGIGLLTWIMAFASSYLFALALGISLPFHFIALAVPIIILLDLLPITIRRFKKNEQHK